jgi:large subunit ribosomal protein L22
MAEEKKTKAAPKAAKKEAAPKAVKEEKAPAPEAKADPKAEKKAAKAAKKAEKKAAKEEAKKAAEKPAKPTPTEAVCFARDVRVTPRKARLVVDLVRGKDVKDALAILKHLNKAAAAPVAKAIKSAAANATNNFGFDEDILYVSEIEASDGLKMKRYTPRAKGSASPVIKRMSNIRVVVRERK